MNDVQSGDAIKLAGNAESSSPLAVEVLRWACVLPAAICASAIAYYVVAVLGFIVVSALAPITGSIYWLRHTFALCCKSFAFSAAGGFTAPRQRSATGVVLAVMSIAVSLLVHVLGQRNVGFTNLLHFAAEAAGAAGGVAGVILACRAAHSSTRDQPMGHDEHGGCL